MTADRSARRARRACVVVAAGMVCALAALGPPRPAAAQGDDPLCVGVRIGDDTSGYYDCLSQELKTDVVKARRQREQLAEIRAHTGPQTDNEMGLYNQAATRMRMGNNFGNSAFPQRPTRQFNAPLFNGR